MDVFTSNPMTREGQDSETLLTFPKTLKDKQYKRANKPRLAISTIKDLRGSGGKPRFRISCEALKG